MCHGKSCKYKNLANRFSSIPRKMVTLYNIDVANLSDFLLHEFCHEDVFNIKRAAFFVDNPDFDLVQGVAGFKKDESYNQELVHWDKPAEFLNHMALSKFDKQVKSFNQSCSIKRNGQVYSDFVKEQAGQMGFNNPKVSTWDLKHRNNGILIYELDEEPDETFGDHLENIVYILSFCPLH